jgi:hypothetical protein
VLVLAVMGLILEVVLSLMFVDFSSFDMKGMMLIVTVVVVVALVIYFGSYKNHKTSEIIGEKGKKPSLRSTLRKFMSQKFPDFVEEKNDNQGINKSFLVYRVNNELNFKYLIFQTSKWGNQLFVETSNKNPIIEGDTTQNKRLGEWEYATQERLEKQFIQIEKKIRKRL